MAEKNMNAKISVEFEETANRQQLSSGDNLPTLFGKIKKFFTDLKPVAMSGSYNDLDDKPVVDEVLDVNSENPIQNKVVAEALQNVDAKTVDTQTLTAPTSGFTQFYPSFVDSNNASAEAEALKTNDAYIFQMKGGTADVEGTAQLILGNTTLAGTDGNMKGQLIFFNNANSYYTSLNPNTAQTANTSFMLPANSGTLALNTVATTSANGLMAATDKTKLDNTNMAYGTCTTAAATAAKAVTITGNTNWKLAVGSEIVVKFTNTNTASNCTLNVNNTGAKQIWFNNAVYTGASSTACGYANRYLRFMYDGKYWVWMGWSLDANTWTAASTSANGYVSTGAQTFAGAKTFNGVVKVAGATAAGTSQVRNIAAGTAAATTTNCPNGALYGQYS